MCLFSINGHHVNVFVNWHNRRPALVKSIALPAGLNVNTDAKILKMTRRIHGFLRHIENMLEKTHRAISAVDPETKVSNFYLAPIPEWTVPRDLKSSD